MRKFFKDEGGLVTIEWVGIAVVMVLAAIAITAYVMQGTEGASNNVKLGVEKAAEVAKSPPGPGQFGNGVADDIVPAQ